MEPNKTMNATLIISIIIIVILIVGGFYILNSSNEINIGGDVQNTTTNQTDTEALENLEQDLNNLDTTTDINFDGIE